MAETTNIPVILQRILKATRRSDGALVVVTMQYERSPESIVGTWNTEGEICLYFRNRLFFEIPILYEYIWFSWNSWRASAIATGVKIANPELSVWQITGDGDALAIGGNHFIHVIRRNVDINIILFNNEIYGLTKGQYSPTSEKGIITKTSPYGTVEEPFSVGELVVGAKGRFFARTMDANVSLSTQVYIEAAKHKGTSVIEVLQNCVIFNDGVHDVVAGKDVRDDRTIILKNGEPMIFGKNKDKGLILDGLKLKVVNLGDKGVSERNILVHDSSESNPGIHYMLANMRYPEYPVALGVIRSVPGPTYESDVEKQISEVKSKSKIKCMDDLLNSGSVWKVE